MREYVVKYLVSLPGQEAVYDEVPFSAKHDRSAVREARRRGREMYGDSMCAGRIELIFVRRTDWVDRRTLRLLEGRRTWG